MAAETNSGKGLIAVFTGNGKGKTTASLGLLMRAAGYGHQVCMIQFIKGKDDCGEHRSLRLFASAEIHTLGRGLTWQSDNIEKDIRLAQEAWEFAREKILSARYRLVILDELTYLINYKMVAEQEILACLKARHKGMHIVITGRDASCGLIEAADLVTEMKEIKHPYQQGVKAQKGFEF
ncbi:MAG: cob(I)yrinic acid a,c-diamide adenosyltransferase [Deltaproteobacteria bacterium]|nr:MAG: cob(I)yrinic acid a,c-diamide adenosyltransferase [Deltaproteobacteria bacterium]